MTKLKKPTWPEEQTLNNAQYQINLSLQRFDAVARDFEASWGIDTLQNLVSADTRGRWFSQLNKLNEAIKIQNAFDVAALVEGCVRG